jgi:hypothetical protein
MVLARIRCNPSGASLDLATEFASQYVPNKNPTLTAVTARVDGAPVSLDSIPPGAAVTFVASWSSDSAETFPVIDTLNQVLVPQRESLDVSWYATAGDFVNERTGRTATEPELDTANMWRAPETPGTVHAWVVLRDSRGGVAFKEFGMTVGSQ